MDYVIIKITSVQNRISFILLLLYDWPVIYFFNSLPIDGSDESFLEHLSSSFKMTYLILNIASGILLSEFLLIYFILRTKKAHTRQRKYETGICFRANYSESLWMPFGFSTCKLFFIEIITNHTACLFKSHSPFLNKHHWNFIADIDPI